MKNDNKDLMKKIIFASLAVFCWMQLVAQQEDFIKDVYLSSQGDSLLFRQLNPQQVVPGKKYPLVVFLHGAGERGNDNEAQLTHGGNMFTNPVNREKYPAFVLFPQCPAEEYWAPKTLPDNLRGIPFEVDPPISTPLQSVKELIDRTISRYPIDTDRIYVVGLSMGGMGTFDLLCRYPDLFAAAVPICGGVNIERLGKIKTQARIRIFHGDADQVVPVAFSREAYLTLKNNGIDVEYIEFPGFNHDSWTSAFNRPDFMEWLFANRK